jgi:hypothetical protein
MYFESGKKRQLFTGVKFESTMARCKEFKDCGFKVSSQDEDNTLLNGFLTEAQVQSLRKHIEDTGHTVYVTHAMAAKQKRDVQIPN